MTELFDYFAAILGELYVDEIIQKDLYEYGMYTLGIVIPIIVLVFVLACIYKVLAAIAFEGVR